MKFNRLKILAMGLIFTLLPFMHLRAQMKGADADKDAIVKVLSSYNDAFNHHDPHALTMLFAENGAFTNSGGDTNHGRQEILEHFVPRFTEGAALMSAQRTYSVKTVDFLKPDLALAYVDAEMSGMKGNDGAAIPARKMGYDVTLFKQGGQWLVGNLHEYDARVGPPAGAARVGGPPAATPAK
jgi:uncharacterized protein (TIGR02246 family)